MTRVVVLHEGFGCMTGCCGHTVYLNPGEDLDYPDEYDDKHFFFGHPWTKDEIKDYAETLVKQSFGSEHIKDLDWDNCLIYDGEEDCCG